jgi:hypothetical protein
MFQVFDNNKPADKTGFSWATTWRNSKFQTFQEASKYADDWLGPYAGMVLKVNVPCDYTGLGDMIEIREVN